MHWCERWFLLGIGCVEDCRVSSFTKGPWWHLLSNVPDQLSSLVHGATHVKQMSIICPSNVWIVFLRSSCPTCPGFLNLSSSPNLSLPQSLMSQKWLIMLFGHLPPPPPLPWQKHDFQLNLLTARLKANFMHLTLDKWVIDSVFHSLFFLGLPLDIAKLKDNDQMWCSLFSFGFWWSEGSRSLTLFLVYYFLLCLSLSSSHKK